MQEMFEKLERLKYGDESIKQNNRIRKYWEELEKDEFDDNESLNDYIADRYNK